MKTTSHIAAISTAICIVLAAAASAAPASKRIASSNTAGASTTSTHTDHKVMKHVGPAGKGYACPH